MLEDIISILKKCLEGDDAAWSRFMDDYAKIALNILNSRFNSIDLDGKEDIVQNIFVKLVAGGLAHFRGTTKYEFLKYFETIVRNEAYTYLSSIKDGEKNIYIDDEDCSVELRNGTTPQDEALEKKQMLSKVYDVLKEYPIVDQRLLLLKIKGNKDKEVATMLNIPIGTVASKYSRMIDKMKKLFGE